MSVGSLTAKIALSQNGETQFLENIQTEGEISYDLGPTGEDIAAVSVGPIVAALRENEPEKDFSVVPQ